MRYRLFLYLWCALAAPAAVSAQSESDASAARPPVLFDLGVRLLGADVYLGYRGLTVPPNPDTILWVALGGGYEWLNYFRDSANHLYTGGGGYSLDDVTYDRINGRFDLGIAQGMVWNERLKFNLLEAFLFYKMRVDYVVDNPSKNELILDSGLPDAAGLLQNSFLIGMSYNDLDKNDPHWKLSGVYAELSAEWAPEFFFNNSWGRADFIRLNLTAKGFLPLFDIDPSAEFNLLSAYLGGFFSVDWCGGTSIPINVQQSFGGLRGRQGLGYAVRGYEDARFDGLFKAVVNAEFRLNLPQFKIIDVFTPGIYVFFDSGYYNYIYYDEQGFLFSSGAGIYLNAWKLTTFTLYVVAPFNHPLIDGTTWVHIGIGLDAHF